MWWIVLALYLLLGVVDVAVALRAMKKIGISPAPLPERVVGVLLWPVVWIVLWQRAAQRRRERIR